MAGALARPVRRPEELADLDGLVVPGGESTTMANLAVRFGVLEPLRAAIRGGLPAYGSCAGMIMLADTVLDAPAGQPTIGGLDVTVRRNALRREGDSLESAGRVSGVAGPPVHAGFLRAAWGGEVGAHVEG